MIHVLVMVNNQGVTVSTFQRLICVFLHPGSRTRACLETYHALQVYTWKERDNVHDSIFYKLAYIKVLKILTTILFVACENSDGLMGFYYSHNGYWNGVFTYEGTKTKMECANTCMGRGSCVAIHTYCYGQPDCPVPDCYHYNNRADLVSSNEKIDVLAKAYIRCLGTYVLQHCLKVAELQY